MWSSRSTHAANFPGARAAWANPRPHLRQDGLVGADQRVGFGQTLLNVRAWRHQRQVATALPLLFETSLDLGHIVLVAHLGRSFPGAPERAYLGCSFEAATGPSSGRYFTTTKRESCFMIGRENAFVVALPWKPPP